MNVFEAVKQSVTTRQAASFYGIRVGRNGMVCCPFHNDRTPSMKVDSRFYCFGCGASGDVIDFAALLHGLGKREAAVRLAEDFGVSYEKSGNAPPDRKRHNRSQPRQKSAEQRFQETERYCFRVLCDYLRLLEHWKTAHAPQPQDAIWHPLCNLVRRTEKGRLRRRGWGLRWEKAQKGGKGTNLRGFFED